MRWCLRVCDGSPTGAAGCGTGLMADSRGAGADKNRGARTHLTGSSFPVSRCGAPRISVTSVPLVPPSARSASLRAARVVVGVYAFGRMWASAPTLGLALLQGPTHRSAPTRRACGISVGADALIRPLHRLQLPSRPAAAKREAVQCDDHPDDLRTIRHGTAVTNLQKRIACPKARPNRRLHRYADPRRAEGHCTGARPSGLFFWTVHGPFSFPQDGKENGGCIPLDKPPAGAETTVAAVRRPISCYPRWSVRPSR